MNQEEIRRVVAALTKEDLEKLDQALAEAEKRTRGARKKRVAKVKQYINNNWEGICYSKAGVRLGAIEGQAFHHIAMRMKRHGRR